MESIVSEESSLRKKAKVGAAIFIAGLSLMYLGKDWLDLRWLFLLLPVMFFGGLKVAEYYRYLLGQNV